MVDFVERDEIRIAIPGAIGRARSARKPFTRLTAEIARFIKTELAIAAQE